MIREKVKRGFTIIEVLVVVTIVGLLATTIISSLQTSRMKGRDARRLTDVHEIRTALVMSYDATSQYPGLNGENNCSGWDTTYSDSDGDGKPFIEGLVDGGFMTRVPSDPLGTTSGSCGGYRYYRYNPGSNGCAASYFYVLGINDMEMTGRPHPQSPGWNCSGRNWSTEVDWVAGSYETQ